MRVSVVIPAYNSEACIERALASVSAQTFRDFEVIVVDDGSTDNTQSVVCGWREMPVRLIAQQNGGPSAARNVGIAAAQGEFVALLDADDQWAPEFLRECVDLLDANAQCGVCTTNVHWQDGHGEFYVKYGAQEIATDGRGVVKDFLRTVMVHRCFPQISALTFRTAMARQYGAFDSDVLCGEEQEMLLRWLPHCEIAYSSKALAYYFNNTVGSFIKDDVRSARASRVFWEKVARYDQLSELPSYSDYRDHRMFRCVCKCILAGLYEDAKRIGELWPTSLESAYWWAGASLAHLPRPFLRILTYTCKRYREFGLMRIAQ